MKKYKVLNEKEMKQTIGGKMSGKDWYHLGEKVGRVGFWIGGLLLGA